MQVLILGVGDAFTKKHYGSSALVRAPSGFLQIDCPDPIHRVLHEATARHHGRHGWQVGVDAIDDILLTHLHGDHCNGVESVGFWRYVLRAQGKQSHLPRLHATRAVVDRLWPRLAPAMDTLIGLSRPARLEDYFDIRILNPDGKTVHRIAGLEVRARTTTHYIPTVGVLVSDGERTFGWSGDSRFEQAHIDWLDQADFFVHEANFPPAHTTLDELAAIPDRIKAKMRLVHLADDVDPTPYGLRSLCEGDLLDI